MSQPFEIRFDFPLAHSSMTISLRATAELHHSDPYYVVDHFHFESAKSRNGEPSLLPPLELKKIQRGSSYVWVHRDSERESLLSVAVGKAIDIGE
jgi:hypothetical protein